MPLPPQALNATETYTLRLAAAQAEDGSTPSLAGVYDGSETFTATLWAGDDRAGVDLSGNVSWKDYTLPEPLLNLAIPASALASLTPAVYQIQVLINPDTEVYRDTIRLLPVAGASAARPTYTTYDDLLRYCPYLDDFSGSPSGQAGFAEEQADAREWLEEIIHRHYRGTAGQSIHDQVVANWGDYRSGRRSIYLMQKLAANALVLTARIRECVAKYAIGSVLRSQVGAASDKTSYQTLGARYRAEADRIAATMTVEMDLNGDNISDIIIDLGSADMLLA